MQRVNLIPTHRRLARQRRTHVRRCVVACAAWAVITVAVTAGSYALWPEDPVVRDRLDRAERDMTALSTAADAARADLTAAQTTLRAARAIANQPDWSLLMALMADAVGPEIVLQGFAVAAPEPVGGGVATAAPAPPPPARGTRASAPPQPQQPVAVRQTITIRGVGRSQLAVTQFILRLERTGLFSRVMLLDTSRETFADQPAVAFQVECALEHGGGSDQAPRHAGGSTGVVTTR